MNRHVVLTSGRSGSNHLVAAINQHPELCNFGEVLGAWTLPARLWSPVRRLGASPGMLLETIYSSRCVYYAAQSLSYAARRRSGAPTHFRRRRKLTSLGVKEFFLHLEEPSVFRWIEACEGLSIIHLRREDRLARALSVLRLEASGRAVARAGDEEAGALRIDPDGLLALLDDLKVEAGAEDGLLQRLAHHECLSLVYERDLRSEESARETVAKVHEFLGVEPLALADTGHRSALRGRAIEAVENRAEVEEAILASAHAELLGRHS